MQIKPDVLIQCLCIDLGIDKGTLSILRHRYKNEGLSLFTKTLPLLSKAVVRSLEVGRINDPSDPTTSITAFAWKSRSRVPNIFGLHEVFTRSGRLKVGFDVRILARLRQVCEYFYKLAVPYLSHDIERAEEKYVETDRDVGDQCVDTEYVDQLRRRVETHYGLDTPVHDILHLFKPRFTPGSFAGSSSTPKGVHWSEYKRSKRETYKVPYGMQSYKHAAKPYPSLRRRHDKHKFALSNERVCEVLFVPKDSRGPRVISKEPSDAIRFQMSFFDWITSGLEKSTAGRILFTDQSKHRELARQGSITGDWSTFDLESASDRVRFDVILRLFRNLPCKKFLLECRSEFSRLPSGRVIKLNKLSGMGSGLTFPSMALLIHLTISEAISRHFRIPYKEAMKFVYVYGDDLIVPTVASSLVADALSRVGLKLNKHKSFCRGKFRESCGADYYNGVSVAPVRCKLSNASLTVTKGMLLNIPDKDEARVSIERHCRELVKAGLWRASDYLYELFEHSWFKLPLVTGENPVLGRFQLYGHGVNIQKRTQAFYPVPVSPTWSERKLNSVYVYNFLGQYLAPRRDGNLALENFEDYSKYLDSKFFNALSVGLAVPHRIKLKKTKIL